MELLNYIIAVKQKLLRCSSFSRYGFDSLSSQFLYAGFHEFYSLPRKLEVQVITDQNHYLSIIIILDTIHSSSHSMFTRPSHRWEENIRMNLKEIGIKSRRTAICQSIEEVQLTGVAPLGAVGHRFRYVIATFYLLL